MQYNNFYVPGILCQLHQICAEDTSSAQWIVREVENVNSLPVPDL